MMTYSRHILYLFLTPRDLEGNQICLRLKQLSTEICPHASNPNIATSTDPTYPHVQCCRHSFIFTGILSQMLTKSEIQT